MNGRPWTEADDALLVKYYPTCGADIPELLLLYKRPYITRRAMCLGIKYEGAQKGSWSVSWTERDLVLLKECYPSVGSKIPELCEKFSEASIRTQAARLKIKCKAPRRGTSIVYDGIPYMTMKAACQAAGVPYHILKNRIYSTGDSPQEVFDALLSEVTDTVFPVTISGIVCKDFNDVSVQLGLSSPSVLHNYMSRNNCSLGDAIRYYSETFVRKSGCEKLGLMAISRAYVTDKGVSYYFCVCRICKTVMLLPENKVSTFQHGNLCQSYAVPDGIRLPQNIRDALKSSI